MLYGFGPDHARAFECAVVGGIGAREAAGVRGCGPRAGLGAAGLEDNQWFLLAQSFGYAHEILAARNVFEVCRDHTRIVVVAEIFEKLHFVKSRLVAHGNEKREPDAVVGCDVLDGRDERARLRHKGNVPRIIHGLTERGIEPVHRINEPKAIGPEKGYACLARDLGDFTLQLLPFLACLGKTSGNDDNGLDALVYRLLEHGNNLVALDNDHGAVDFARDFGERLVAFFTEDLVGLGVNRVYRPGEISGNNVVKHGVAGFVGVR